jgi:hypothetical protein
MSNAENSLPNIDVETIIVNEELEAFYSRCEERGVGRNAAKSSLLLDALHGTMKSYQQSIKQTALTFPGATELENAYKLATRGAKNSSAFTHACEEWLFARCGARPGDVVSAGGWSVPREILIQEVALDWNWNDVVEDGRVVLRGPTKHSKGVDIRSNLTFVHESLTKIEPSKSLFRFCHEHGIQVQSR